MAQRRGRNQNPLLGADPALIQILTRMENRDSNRDNACKKFLMFPAGKFDGKDKTQAKAHWLEFEKYLSYHEQYDFVDRADFDEVTRMFHLTLTEHALGWYDSESLNWTNEDDMKQAFLQRFNVWGDTRRQQQNCWNKSIFLGLSISVSSEKSLGFNLCDLDLDLVRIFPFGIALLFCPVGYPSTVFCAFSFNLPLVICFGLVTLIVFFKDFEFNLPLFPSVLPSNISFWLNRDFLALLASCLSRSSDLFGP